VPTVFALNAPSFFAAAVALIWWRRPPQPGLDDRELLGAAVRAGFRYVRSARLIRRILLRSALFALPASALWALLPLVASERLGLQSSGYGVLLGAVGAGALVGVFLLPVLRRRVSDNAMLTGSSVGFAAGSAGAATFPLALTIAALVLAGAAWIGTLTVLNAALQLTLPQWVRSRGAAFYLLVFSGTMAVGSYLWGVVAEHIGTPAALLVSAGVLVCVALTVTWWGLRPGTGTIDRSFSMTWPMPTLMLSPRATDGPVTVTVRYAVPPSDDAAFVTLMKQVELSRRRTGASRWRLYRSGEDPTVLLETFVVPSWGEYRRQQTDRRTGFDRELQDRARSLSTTPPVEEHLFLADDVIDAGDPSVAAPAQQVTRARR
jgi:MFS family permease